MANPLFKSTSPLMGWFIVMELITAACLGAYWFGIWQHGSRPWDHVGLGVIVAVLFVASNGLLFRHRRWAVVGFIVCGLLLVLLMLPTV
jgi:hypothetical protein